MKNLYVIFLSLLFLRYSSQIELINTGTNSNLTAPSIIGQNIIVNGIHNYLFKSYSECDNLTSLLAPGPIGYWNYLKRTDTTTAYILSCDIGAYNSKIYKSVDGGYNWVLKLDTPNFYVSYHAFFDSLEGIALGTFGKCIRTKDGGNSWLSSSNPLTVVTAIKAYGDSMLCIGGGTGGAGDFLISKDRGDTWFGGNDFGGFAGGNPNPTDFFFLNKDTIFGIATGGWDGVPFVKSFNGGKNWQFNIITTENVKPYGLYAKSKKEIYAVGVTSGTIGIILKTTDLGQSWTSFNTGIKTTLTGINFLNDSVALISGTNGILFKWNSKQSIFTGIGENSLDKAGFKIFPNPIKDKLHVEFENLKIKDLKLKVINTLGQEVYSEKIFDSIEELDLSFLKAGVYYLKLESKSGDKVFKIIKE